MKKNIYFVFSITFFAIIGFSFFLSSFFLYKKHKSSNITKENTAFIVDNPTQQANLFLKEHNRIRKERGVPPLKWSKNLENYAREWANNLASSCNLEHRKRNKYGENLAMGGGMGNNPITFVKMWEDEKQAFDEHFGNGGKCCDGNFFQYGHYSQLIWKTTTEVGCAIVKCSNGGYVAVCNYNPPGNMQGGKPY